MQTSRRCLCLSVCLSVRLTLSQHKLYSVKWEVDCACILFYLTTLSQLHSLHSVEWEVDCAYFLVYLTTLSQLHSLYSVEWENDCASFLVYLTFFQLHKLCSFKWTMNMNGELERTWKQTIFASFMVPMRVV